MIAVIVVASILGIMGLVGYNLARNKHNINESISQVQLLANDIKAFFQNQPSYDALSIPLLKNTGILAKNMCNSANNCSSAASNLFGGRILAEPSVQKGATSFAISYTDLPKTACIQLAAMDWDNKKTSVVGVSVGTANGIYEHPFTDKYLPVTITAATAVCEQGSAVTWTIQ
jgi:hypothetical protein